MPTGYTCDVQDGKITELKDYILSCAKGFGAFIHMRDDSLSQEITYRKVDDYHLKQLNKAKKDYENFLKMTDEEIQNRLDKNHNQAIKDKQDGLERFKVGKQKYLDMLDKVQNWNPPTQEHIKLKEFALQQLRDSLDFDYSKSLEKYYLEQPVKDTIEGFKQWKLNSCLKDFEYHSRSYREEKEGVEKNNQWIKDLVNSFNVE